MVFRKVVMHQHLCRTNRRKNLNRIRFFQHHHRMHPNHVISTHNVNARMNHVRVSFRCFVFTMMVFRWRNRSGFLNFTNRHPILKRRSILSSLLTSNTTTFSNFTQFSVSRSNPSSTSQISNTIIMRTTIFHDRSNILRKLKSNTSNRMSKSFLSFVVRNFIRIRMKVTPSFRQPRQQQPTPLKFLFFLRLNDHLSDELNHLQHIGRRIPTNASNRNRNGSNGMFGFRKVPPAWAPLLCCALRNRKVSRTMGGI